ncbi:hypothetical protein GCM10010358_32620 [Streptomyces minutiscleroticus]|uniref:PPM-type phosphatase domain-containing protein n=1 Tax=Streptomyces minutiscleroticus TaxID=68238 RepID=A0A918NIJ4_9ACTN|nr:hypothetical protein GCM10010358_32620 [Streptomyces minutiscleroticus]
MESDTTRSADTGTTGPDTAWSGAPRPVVVAALFPGARSGRPLDDCAPARLAVAHRGLGEPGEGPPAGPTGGTVGGRRLRRALGECAGLPAKAVVERVRMLVSEWAGGARHDDMAVVAVGAPRNGRPGTGRGRGSNRCTA